MSLAAGEEVSLVDGGMPLALDAAGHGDSAGHDDTHHVAPGNTAENVVLGMESAARHSIAWT